MPRTLHDPAWWYRHPRVTVREEPWVSAARTANAPLPPLPPWMSEGRCAAPGADPDLWFPEDPRGVARAEAICRACPVVALCLKFALEQHRNGQDLHGVWGGTSRFTRRQLLRRRRAA